MNLKKETELYIKGKLEMIIKNNTLKIEYIPLYSLTNKKIGIPIFQRFFDWKKEQTNEILNDILQVMDYPDSHIYLLDFIFYEEDGMIKLADGQQRIVSFNILIKVINTIITENNINNPPIKEFDISYDIDEYDAKFKNSFLKGPCAPFKYIFIYFKEFINENIDKLDLIIDIIKNKVFVYMKRCENADDAFSIFQQINTGGKPLNKNEIISTSINQYSDIYDIKIKCNTKELKQIITSYYKVQTENLNKNFDNIAIMAFLKNYITKTKEKFNNFSDAIDIISQSNKSSICAVANYIKRTDILEILNVLAMKKIDIEIKKEYMDNLLLPLCLLSIVLSIKKINPGGVIKSLYLNIIQMIKDENTNKEISSYLISFINEQEQICKISMNEFKIALGSKTTDKNIKKAILIMDAIKNNTSGSINIKMIEYEHIYPQKPSLEWAQEAWPTNEEEKQDIINNIGNCILLNGKINGKIQNKYITYKMTEYAKIYEKDLCLTSEMNHVDFDRFEKERSEYIKERQRKICDLIYEHFFLGKVIIIKDK